MPAVPGWRARRRSRPYPVVDYGPYLACMNGSTLTIGALARAAGVGVETVRFYERKGLLAPPPRTR